MKVKSISRLIIVGFGHAGRTYLDASINLSKYIDEIYVYDPLINIKLVKKYNTLKKIKVSFLKTKFNSKFLNKNTILILAASGRHKIKILKLIKSEVKLIIIEKPPALNKIEYNFIKKNFPPKKIYYALHASKGLEITQTKKVLGKLKRKDLIGLNISQLFVDPYGKNSHNSKSLINSWTDSGVNALSIIGEIFGDVIKGLKFDSKKSNLVNNSLISALFTVPSIDCNYRITTSWDLGIDLKITQINLPRKGLRLTLDHSKQQLYHGFSTQLIHKKAVKIDKNRLKAHYYEVLKEAIVKIDTSRAHKNMDLISDNFYSVIKKLK